MLTFLIKKGADVNLKDVRGFTPLHDAAQAGRDATAKYLISHGANVNVTNKLGENPLDVARYVSMDKLLIANGAKGHKALRAILLEQRKQSRIEFEQRMQKDRAIREQCRKMVEPISEYECKRCDGIKAGNACLLTIFP